MEPFKKSYELEGKTWGAGNKIIVQLAGLPKAQRLLYVTIEIIATIANSGAPAVIYPRQLSRLFATIEHKSPFWSVRATGKSLWNAYKNQNGKSLNNAAVTASTGTVMYAHLHLTPIDVNAANPLDAAQPSELLEGKTIEITCAATAATGTTNCTVSAATIKCTAWFAPGAGDVLPQKVKQDYADWNQQTALLSPGAYSQLFIYDESDDVVTLTEYSKLRVQFDGREVVDNLPCEQLVAMYNHLHVQGASQDNELEQLPADNLLFLPVITADKGYKATQLPTALGVARADITGTATSTRFAYRCIELASESDENDGMRAFGVKEPERTPRAPKTLSKAEPSGSPARVAVTRALIPKRFAK